MVTFYPILVLELLLSEDIFRTFITLTTKMCSCSCFSTKKKFKDRVMRGTFFILRDSGRAEQNYCGHNVFRRNCDGLLLLHFSRACNVSYNN